MRFYIAGALMIPASLFAFTTLGFAHGGQYRGPGDTVDPGAGSRGGKTGNHGRPGVPYPGSPGSPTGSPARGPSRPYPPGSPLGGPTGLGGRAVTGGGGEGGVDLSQWQFWWEFNKDRFLQLKKALRSRGVTSGTDDFTIGRAPRNQAIDILSPTTTDRKFVTEALKKALNDPDSNRDIISSCMIALAKIGLDKSILKKMKINLRSRDQEISETASLAMGIANLVEAVPALLSLANDTKEGRNLLQRDRTPFRTRSFACYGLGLIAYATKAPDKKEEIFQAMRALIEDESLHNRDIKVAAFQAIRLLRPAVDTNVGKDLSKRAVEFLGSFIQRTKVNPLVQAHAYTALADLVGRSNRFDQQGKVKEAIAETLKNRRQRGWIHQSAALALGQIATPEDFQVCSILQDYMTKGKDPQARSFCAISLGQIGGEKNRNFLLSKLKQRRTRTMLKPWIALGVAVESYRVRQRNLGAPLSSAAKEIVYQAFKQEKNRLTASAFGIALGLMQNKDAEEDIVDRMLKYRNTPQACGYMALSLGLLGAEAKTEINGIVDRSSHFDSLLMQASIALGLLGDKEIGSKLINRMKDPDQGLAVQSALAQALGFIGDKRSIKPLVEMLHDSKSYKDIPRAFAAVALGLICDKEEFPWNSKISMNMNYRANTETLTGSSTGVLDLL